MRDFLVYFQLGWGHVLDVEAVDHLLFLIVLVGAYTLRHWKQLLWLVSAFTFGHTLTLALALYKVLSAPTAWIELLIPITILITACHHIFTGGKTSKSPAFLLWMSFGFGGVHGMAFSNYLKLILQNSEAKWMPLLEFALGIEAVQALIVLLVTLLFYTVHFVFKVSKRDWVLVLCSGVIGVTIPIIIERIAFLF